MKIDNVGTSVKFVTYSSRMVDDPAGIAEELRQSAKDQGIKFDTIVGRGSSGMLIVPIVARILRKKWFIVRKDEEVQSSHDSSCKWMGELGKRWIFLDDFCSSGQTFRKVRDGVKAAVKEATASYQSFGYPPDGGPGRMDWYTYTRPAFETDLVGYFQYESRDEGCRTLVPWNNDARPGYNDMYWDDTPGVLARRAAEEAEQAEMDRNTVTDASGAVIGTLDEVAALAAGKLLDQEVKPAPYRSILSGCTVDNCIVCKDADKPTDDKIEIQSWGSTAPITTRYALQMAAYTNPQSNMIVRGI